MATINGNNADNSLEGGIFADTISGSGGNDLLLGRASDDTLFGGSGNDVLDGGSGGDAMFGGSGIDTVRYSGGGEIIVSLSNGGRDAEAEGDSYNGIENVDLSGKTDRGTVFGDSQANVLGGSSLADGLLGSGGNDVLLGAGGNDQLQGGNGDDLIFGGTGSDQIDGGPGSDTASYVNSASKVVVDLRLVGIAQVGASSSSDSTGDILRNVENVVGSGFGDTLTGNDGANRLAGGKGFNTLEGLLGDDSYSHVADAVARDIVIDTGGSDILALPLSSVASIFRQSSGSILDPDDLVVQMKTPPGGKFSGVTIVDHFSPGHAVETLFDTNTGQTFILAEGLIGGPGNGIIGGTAGNDTMDSGGGNDLLFGVAGNDVAEGGEGDDSVSGGLGHDTLFGGNGNDVLEGAAGNDQLLGEAGADVIGGGNGDDTADGGSGSDTITGYNGRDELKGGIGNDRLYGGNGDDRLFGGDGEDRLVGEDGADKLWGGSAADVFLFETADGATNRVLDFEDGADRIVFDADLFEPGQLRRQAVDLDGDGLVDGRLRIVDASGQTLTTVEVLGDAAVSDVLFE